MGSGWGVRVEEMGEAGEEASPSLGRWVVQRPGEQAKPHTRSQSPDRRGVLKAGCRAKSQEQGR